MAVNSFIVCVIVLPKQPLSFSHLCKQIFCIQVMPPRGQGPTTSWFYSGTGSPPSILHVVGVRITPEHTVLLRFIQSSATQTVIYIVTIIEYLVLTINAGNDFSDASIYAQKLGCFSSRFGGKLLLRNVHLLVV